MFSVGLGESKELNKMPKLTSIIKHYHSSPIRMDYELADALRLYKEYVAGGPATEVDVLRRCLTGNHFKCLHLTASERTKLIGTTVTALCKAKILMFKGGDFEDLYNELQKTIGGINQIGPLVLYDTSKMIGHVLGIEPSTYVYVQSGAKEGAKILLGKKRMGRKLPTIVFNKLFPGEKSIYIEDMLCIYKKDFQKGGVRIGSIFSTSTKNPCSTNPNVKIKYTCK